MTVDREEHIAWCKRRALQYVEIGELDNAMASMGSDLNSEECTRDHPVMKLWLQFRMMGKMTTENEVRNFINGFH